MINLTLIYVWVFKCTVNFTPSALGSSKPTVISLFQELRKLCINKCMFNNKKIGGIGHEIELDETKVFTRKYHKGRLLFGDRKKC